MRAGIPESNEHSAKPAVKSEEGDSVAQVIVRLGLLESRFNAIVKRLGFVLFELGI
jgi:hypothetical protein